MRTFAVSTVIAIAALIAAFFWGGWEAVATCALLSLMEVSFSFDNAVVNATVLSQMSARWQQRFLTWGMLIAVFGMRLLFPLLVVAFATGLHVWDVATMALNHPSEYSRHVLAAHVQIASFGGMFLLMVFLKFVMDEHKTLHWFVIIERRLSKLGKLEAAESMLALIVLLVLQHFLPEEERLHAVIAGVVGIVLYVAVNGAAALAGEEEYGAATKSMAYSGLTGFIYLQFLDASFSLDGVIGAFAISNDVVIIMLGLGVGAMFVRSLTIYLVHKGTLDKYKFLEHGAHYGIGALALIMLVSLLVEVPEAVAGLVGVTFIAWSFWSSVKYNRRKLTN